MTDPLFVADLDTLKKQLRLSGVPVSNEDALAVLNDAILRARLAFYRRLGEQRVTDLLAITFLENPVDNDTLLRALANTVEVRLVWVELLRRMPQAWMDASGDVNRRWNEEAPVREKSSRQSETEIKRLLDDIEEDMQMLAAEESLSDETSIYTYDGTPDETPPRPGDSIRGSGLMTAEED